MEKVNINSKEKNKEYSVMVSVFDLDSKKYKVISNNYGIIDSGIVKGNSYNVKFRSCYGDRVNIEIGDLDIWISIEKMDVIFQYNFSSIGILVQEIGGD
ncbi:MAG: hypothetical protein QXV17_11615 [Candidatus Micrarchaeaceae archaeon]